MDENNIFDEDETLDYIIYEDLEADGGKGKNRGGCLTVFALLILQISFLITGIL